MIERKRARQLVTTSVQRGYLPSCFMCALGTCMIMGILMYVALLIYIVQANVLPDDDLIYQLNFHNRSSAKPCQQSAFLVLVINSYPTHVERRNAIRRSWGDGSEYVKRINHPYAWRILFVIGRTGKPENDRQIEEESQMHGDLILGEFIDCMKNLTYKTLLGMQWAHRNCHPRFFFKGDDDIFVNAPLLFDTVREFALTRYDEDIWICRSSHSLLARMVVRDRRNKYFVSYEDYPADHFPKFCSGFAYLMSGSVVKKLLLAVKSVRVIHSVDDVYVAILGRQYNVVPQHDNSEYIFLHMLISTIIMYALRYDIRRLL